VQQNLFTFVGAFLVVGAPSLPHAPMDDAMGM